MPGPALPLGFLGGLQLGDRFITVDRSMDRVGAGVVPVFDSDTPELPTDSPNWRRQFVARFDKMESGSGPVGQEALHTFLDQLEAAIVALGSRTGDVFWIPDATRSASTIGIGAPGINVTITVDDLGPLDLTLGDYVLIAGTPSVIPPGVPAPPAVWSGYAWGQVNVIGAHPPETLRVATLSDYSFDDMTLYRAYRVYSGVRVLGFDPGPAQEESMDGFRYDMKLRLDSTRAPLVSAAGMDY